MKSLLALDNMIIKTKANMLSSPKQKGQPLYCSKKIKEDVFIDKASIIDKHTGDIDYDEFNPLLIVLIARFVIVLGSLVAS